MFSPVAYQLYEGMNVFLNVLFLVLRTVPAHSGAQKICYEWLSSLRILKMKIFEVYKITHALYIHDYSFESKYLRLYFNDERLYNRDKQLNYEYKIPRFRSWFSKFSTLWSWVRCFASHSFVCKMQVVLLLAS